MTSEYIVSARKYRPTTFASVVGQEALTTTLRNSIRSGRLAHAYLFCGPRGVGKTTCARIFAKTINCLSPREGGEACEACESCRAFNEQRSYNIHELDAASNNGVDDIRQLIEQVNIPPQIGRYKVFIIDEVHMLSPAAFNAFLKTLEEPPAHAVFILATTEKHKLLPTILSRCQIYDFNRMNVRDIVGHLENVARAEGIAYEPEALSVIAQKADGGMRDALSIFDQVASFCQNNITYQGVIADLNVLDSDYYFRAVDDLLKGSVPNLLLTLNEILAKGFEGSHFVGGLSTHLRSLLVSRDEQTVRLLETSDEVRARYAEQARRCPPKWLYAAIRLCTDCDINYRQSQNRRLLVELTLIEMAQLAQGGDDDPASGLGPTQTNTLLLRLCATKLGAGLSALKCHRPPRPLFSTKRTATPKPAAERAPRAPQQNAPAAPTAQPAAATPHAAALRFSIRSTAAAAPANAEQAESPAQAARRLMQAEAEKLEKLELDETALLTAWRTFASFLPKEETATAMRMKYTKPTLNPDGRTVEVAVDSPLVESDFKRIADDLAAGIRAFLHSDELRLDIRVREEAERPRTYSRAEQFGILCKENPALAKLKEALSLELA